MQRDTVDTTEYLKKFEPTTLRGCWERRYHNARRKYGIVATQIYDAVDLLRQARVDLHPLTVMVAVKLLANHNEQSRWQWLWTWQRWHVQRVLQALMQTERILEPCIGQIEAKGTTVNMSEYLALLAEQLPEALPKEILASSQAGIAVTARDQQKYEIALASVKRILALKPGKDMTALMLRFQGELLTYQSGYEAELTSYNEALNLNPNDAEVLYNKGIVLDELGRYEEAIAAYDAALRFQPYDHEILYNKGIVLDQLGRYEESVAAYDAALKAQPNDADTLENKGIALNYLGRYQEAISLFDQLNQAQPASASPWYNKACSYVHLQQTNEALACLQTAIELDSTHEYLEMVQTDPDFDSLRSHPQFRALLTNG